MTLKIGLRIPWTIAREVPLPDFAAWCKQQGFDAIDLGQPSAEAAKAVRDAGLQVGTIDLGGTCELLSADPAVRDKGITAAVAALQQMHEIGADRAFCVFFPHDRHQSRRDSFENWKQAFPVVVAEAERQGVRIAVEGWPGPNNSALGVTPETLRAMFAAVPSDHFGINYDPSHLVRVGVDYKRFLDEFASRVIHAHGKDAALNPQGAYLYGNIGTTFAEAPAFGDGDWRYCIPGEGDVNWAFVCGRLHQASFDGIVSLELEDLRYNGSQEGEERGLLRGKAHLLPYL